MKNDSINLKKLQNYINTEKMQTKFLNIKTILICIYMYH